MIIRWVCWIMNKSAFYISNGINPPFDEILNRLLAFFWKPFLVLYVVWTAKCRSETHRQDNNSSKNESSGSWNKTVNLVHILFLSLIIPDGNTSIQHDFYRVNQSNCTVIFKSGDGFYTKINVFITSFMEWFSPVGIKAWSIMIILFNTIRLHQIHDVR